MLKLPWKSLTSIIEYYYMWKTTDRYVQQVSLPPVSLSWFRPIKPGRGSRPLSQPERWIPALRPLPHSNVRARDCDVPVGGRLICASVFPSGQKRLKAAEAESKLKQVYIPT